MDWLLLLELTLDKLQDPGLYVLVVLVGSLINLYGQVLVPYLRDIRPVDAFREEVDKRPALVALSVLVGFAFPLAVATVSAVATRYQAHDLETAADFPDAKPDPVFRVDLEGRFVQQGRAMHELLQAHPADRVQQVIGEGHWAAVKLAAADGHSVRKDLHFVYGGTHYLVANSVQDAGTISLYFTELSGDADSICTLPSGRNGL